MPRYRFWFLAPAALVAACTHKQATTPPAVPATTTAATTPAPGPAASTPVTAPNVAVAGDLAQRCNLHFASRADAPKFAYDEFQLLPEDRTLLEQVAECLTRGPLHGKGVKLTGRADPRGTDEYNLGLGTRRAQTVSGYLQRLGVAASQLSASTRGDLDAAGTDETGWRLDRRVDLQLRD